MSDSILNALACRVHVLRKKSPGCAGNCGQCAIESLRYINRQIAGQEDRNMEYEPDDSRGIPATWKYAGDGLYMCSSCGQTVFGEDVPSFCPLCGADMIYKEPAGETAKH